MFKDTFTAAFTGTLSRYKHVTFTKPNPRIEKGVVYRIEIDDAGTVKLLPVQMPERTT